uniref:Uncharacterized protein n=1 Tax=Oryza punctata TaxID=4537 RepID=A0A0E0M5Q9_ORYPU
MAVLKKDARALFLAAIVLMAMALLSPAMHKFAINNRDYCGEILPCDDSACRYYCQKMGYRYPHPRCNTAKPGQANCCCLKNVGDWDSRRLLSN